MVYFLHYSSKSSQEVYLGDYALHGDGWNIMPQKWSIISGNSSTTIKLKTVKVYATVGACVRRIAFSYTDCELVIRPEPFHANTSMKVKAGKTEVDTIRLNSSITLSPVDQTDLILATISVSAECVEVWSEHRLYMCSVPPVKLRLSLRVDVSPTQNPTSYPDLHLPHM